MCIAAQFVLWFGRSTVVSVQAPNYLKLVVTKGSTFSPLKLPSHVRFGLKINLLDCMIVVVVVKRVLPEQKSNSTVGVHYSLVN
jgi:hypothetical protein